MEENVGKRPTRLGHICPVGMTLFEKKDPASAYQRGQRRLTRRRACPILPGGEDGMSCVVRRRLPIATTTGIRRVHVGSFARELTPAPLLVPDLASLARRGSTGRESGGRAELTGKERRGEGGIASAGAPLARTSYLGQHHRRAGSASCACSRCRELAAAQRGGLRHLLPLLSWICSIWFW
jgi:hypothetical protein